MAMLPPSFPDKGDVVARIFEDWSRAHVKVYIAAHNRLLPKKYAKFGDSALLSLDAVLFEGGITTGGDTVSQGLWE